MYDYTFLFGLQDLVFVRRPKRSVEIIGLTVVAEGTKYLCRWWTRNGYNCEWFAENELTK